MSDLPIVSCIMPTRNRREFIPGAVRSWLAQDYPPELLQLIVIDNSDQPIGDLLPMEDLRISHYWGGHRMPVGFMRNLACSYADGDLICHWDDDDWYAPNRVSQQVTILSQLADPEDSEDDPYYQAVGFDNVLFARDFDQKAWRYSRMGEQLEIAPGAAVPSRYVVGVSLMYRREWWERHRFPSVEVMGGIIMPQMEGEDNRFIQQLGTRLVVCRPISGTDTIVARIHETNTCPKTEERQLTANPPWVPAEWSEVNAVGYEPAVAAVMHGV